MTAAELAARRTMARAILDDFRRELAAAPLTQPPGREWMLRLATALGRLLDALDAGPEPDTTGVCHGCGMSADRCVRYGCGGQVPPPPRPRIDGSIAATGVRPDGSAALSPADLLTVLGALHDAARWADLTAGTREQHLDDPDLATAYRAVAIRLGDDRR